MYLVLVELGPISIRFYGLMYMIGIVLAMVMLRREVKRKGLPLSDEEVVNFLLFLVFSGVVGACLYYVAFHWDYYGANPSQIPEAAAGLLFFFEAAWYSGAIYGAVNATHKWNRDQEHEWLRGLERQHSPALRSLSHLPRSLVFVHIPF